MTKETLEKLLKKTESLPVTKWKSNIIGYTEIRKEPISFGYIASLGKSIKVWIGGYTDNEDSGMLTGIPVKGVPGHLIQFEKNGSRIGMLSERETGKNQLSKLYKKVENYIFPN